MEQGRPEESSPAGGTAGERPARGGARQVERAAGAELRRPPLSQGRVGHRERDIRSYWN